MSNTENSRKRESKDDEVDPTQLWTSDNYMCLSSDDDEDDEDNEDNEVLVVRVKKIKELLLRLLSMSEGIRISPWMTSRL